MAVSYVLLMFSPPFPLPLLPLWCSVYATTAASPDESSYACYYDSKLGTYLGDVYSVKWMENVDKVERGRERV